MSAQRPVALRLFAGLLLGVGLGIWLMHAWLASAQGRQRKLAGERMSVIALQAMIDIVQRTGGTGDAVRAAATAWTEENQFIRSIRVINLDERSLEASTVPADLERGNVPRRLVRDEKPLYDQGQRLRAAIDTNREEKRSRKEEIEAPVDAAGIIHLAAPFEIEGEVAGMIQMDALPALPPVEKGYGAAAAAVALPIAIFAVLALPLRRKPGVLTAVATLLLVGGLAAYALHTISAARATGAALTALVDGRMNKETVRAETLIANLGLPNLPPVKAKQWDVDLFREPRTMTADRLAEEHSGVAGKTATAISLLAFAVFAFFGFGAAGLLWRTLRTNRSAYSYVFPAMIGMIVLVFLPFLYGITLSFTDQNIYNTNKPIGDIWIGLENYSDILGDFAVAKETAGRMFVNYKNFYWTLGFTIVWTVTNVAVGVTLGLILALMLNVKGLVLKPAYRVLLILPWAVPNYITALIWRGMFHQQYGVINQLFQIFGGSPVSWFEHPMTSFAAVLATNGWLSFPFMMVISLGALQSIPADLYEAARVDGATRRQQFLAITLPSLKPALIPATILSVVWTFNMFNIIYLVSAGEPAGSTEILITSAYKIAFEQYRYGYAAAYSTIIFIILLVYGVFQNRITRATESIA